MKAVVLASELSDAVRWVTNVAFGDQPPKKRELQHLALNASAAGLDVSARSEAEVFGITRCVNCLGPSSPATVPLAVQVGALTNALDRFGSWDGVDITVIQPGSRLRIADVNGASMIVPVVGVGPALSRPSGSPTNSVEMSAIDLFDLSSVSRLVATEKFRPEFNQWVVQFAPDVALSVCGDGGIFAAIERRNLREYTPMSQWTLAVHGQQIAPVLRALKSYGTDTVLIDDCTHGPDTAVTMVIRPPDTIFLLGAVRHPYPDVRKFLDRHSAYRFVAEASDWVSAARTLAKSALPTYRRLDEVHVTHLLMTEGGSTITMAADDETKTSHEMPVVATDGSWAGVLTKSNVVTESILEVARMAKGHGYVQVEMIDNKTPLVIRFSNDPMIVDKPWVADGRRGGWRRTTMILGLFNRKPKQPISSETQGTDARPLGEAT